MKKKKTEDAVPESTLQIAGAIAANPKLAETMDMSVLNGHAWATLVGARPEMASKCEFSKFSAVDWISVLSRQPQLADQLRFTGSSADVDDLDLDFDLLDNRDQQDDRVRHVAKSSNIFPCGRWEYVLDNGGAVITGIAERGGFEWDDKIEELRIPARVDGLRVVGTGERAFRSFYALRRVVVANGVKFIGPCSFAGCSKLVSITLPNSIVEIMPQAFASCESLSAVEIPPRVKYIGYNAFDSTDLTEVTIPDSVVELDNHAFKDCSRLKRFIIGNLTVTCSRLAA